tara:strand:- start:1291 stop:2214 length:924 start_codon:yes stop_codon:yes gene_type:complete
MSLFPSSIYLNWNSKNNWNVSFRVNCSNSSSKYITSVNLRDAKKTIKVYASVKNKYCKVVKDDKIQKRFSNSPLLKSNLQKCVRLGKTEEALVTALNLIQIDLFNFVRRLIIISIEDVGVVLDNIELLVFLLMSYQNIEITNEIIQELLLTVYSLCVYPTKHIPSSDNTELDYLEYDYNDTKLVSLIIASEYGGFHGDILLYKKMINSFDRKILSVKKGNLILTRGINRNDILISSVDHHCNPLIIDYITENTHLKGDIIKSLIWNNSSKINYRESHEIIDNEVWKNVTKFQRKYALQIISKMYYKN